MSYIPEILLSARDEGAASARDNESAISATSSWRRGRRTEMRERLRLGSEGVDDSSSSDETSSSASSAPSSTPALISDQEYQRELDAIANAMDEARQRRRMAVAALGGA